jgi:hypothetical protein
MICSKKIKFKRYLKKIWNGNDLKICIFKMIIYLMLFACACCIFDLKIVLIVCVCMLVIFLSRAWKIYKNNIKDGHFVILQNEKNSFKIDAYERTRCMMNLYVAYFSICVVLIRYKNNDLVLLIAGVSLIFFLFVIVSIRYNLIFLKVATLFVSTIVGSTCISIAGAQIIILLSEILEKYVGNEAGPRTKMDLFDQTSIISLSYVFEKYYLVTIVFIVLTCILFLIYIKAVPVYQIDKLKVSLQILNLIMVVIGIGAFYYANAISKTVEYTLKNGNINVVPEIAIYMQSYGPSNFRNHIYVLGLPYTFGILLANLSLERKIKSYEKKKRELICKIILEKEDHISMKKNFYILSGTCNEYKLLENVMNKKCL